MEEHHLFILYQFPEFVMSVAVYVHQEYPFAVKDDVTIEGLASQLEADEVGFTGVYTLRFWWD